MVVSNDLYELIHSLSKSEKGYFKKYTSMHVRGDSNNYTLLFDAIEKQKKYDEKKLLKQFQGEKFTNQFSVAKNYLYNLILETLESFHDTTESKLNSSLNQIDILFKKRLYKQAEKLIESSKKTALYYQKHLHFIALTQRELFLISSKRYGGINEDAIDKIFDASSKEISSVKNLFEYWKLNSKIFFHIKQKGGVIRNNADKEIFEALISHPLLINEEGAESFLAAVFYHTCLVGYSFSSDDMPYMHKHSLSMLNLLEQNKHLADETPQMHISALLNLAIAQLGLREFNKIPVTIDKMRALVPESEHMRNLLFEQTNTIEMQYLTSSGQFEKALELFKKVEKVFSESKQAVLHEHQMPLVYFNKALVMYGLGNLHESAKLLNQGLNTQGLDYRSDLHCFAKIFSLVVHFELGNQDLLDYIIRSTYRYLLKRNRLYKFENIVIEYIRKKMPQDNSKILLKKAFANLLEELEALQKDPFEKNALEYFDYITWLESKIKERSYAEMVREKAGV